MALKLYCPRKMSTLERSMLSTPVWLVKRPKRLPLNNLLNSGSVTLSMPSTTLLDDFSTSIFFAFVSMQPLKTTIHNNNSKIFLNMFGSPLVLSYHYTISENHEYEIRNKQASCSRCFSCKTVIAQRYTCEVLRSAHA